MVLRELVTACLLAASPTRRSPLLVNATTEGVVRLPSEFSRTEGSPPSMTAMQEFVVPKSMPSTFAIKSPNWFLRLEFVAGFGVIRVRIISAGAGAWLWGATLPWIQG